MRECDAQPAALVAPSGCWIIIHGYVCVTDTYILHMRTAGWSHVLIVSVIYEMDTVCVNAMRSLQRLLHAAG